MTKKRFTIEDDLFIREKTTQIVMEIPFKEDCKNMCELLNAFHEENEELKQFKQNVFGLIDKNIEKDKHEYEMTYEDYLNGRIEVLKKLKKELNEE